LFEYYNIVFLNTQLKYPTFKNFSRADLVADYIVRPPAPRVLVQIQWVERVIDLYSMKIQKPSRRSNVSQLLPQCAWLKALEWKNAEQRYLLLSAVTTVNTP
jgi:hypothetical protein